MTNRSTDSKTHLGPKLQGRRSSIARSCCSRTLANSKSAPVSVSTSPSDQSAASRPPPDRSKGIKSTTSTLQSPSFLHQNHYRRLTGVARPQTGSLLDFLLINRPRKQNVSMPLALQGSGEFWGIDSFTPSRIYIPSLIATTGQSTLLWCPTSRLSSSLLHLERFDRLCLHRATWVGTPPSPSSPASGWSVRSSRKMKLFDPLPFDC